MAKSKKKVEEEVKAKLPKNPNEYSYRGDEDVVMKADQFLQLAKAIEVAIAEGVTADYPTKVKYIASATGIDVPNPTQEEINTGAVRPMMDVEGSFAQDNLIERYEAWLVPDVIGAKNLFFEIHARNVELGNATPQKILIEERQARQKAAEAENRVPEEIEVVAEEVKLEK